MEGFMLSMVDRFGYLGIFLLILIENIFPPIPSEAVLLFGGALTVSTSMNVPGTILAATLGQELEDYTYQEKGGVTARQVQESGLLPTTSPKSFYSREHITGRQGPIQVEAADVTFPIQEGKFNAMFSGCYIRLTWPGADLPALTVRRGALGGLSLPVKQKAILDEMCGYIPGNLYLHVGGERAELLLRGRFLGFRINPLMPVDEANWNHSPLPELDQALRLVRLMGRGNGPRV